MVLSSTSYARKLRCIPYIRVFDWYSLGKSVYSIAAIYILVTIAIFKCKTVIAFETSLLLVTLQAEVATRFTLAIGWSFKVPNGATIAAFLVLALKASGVEELFALLAGVVRRTCWCLAVVLAHYKIRSGTICCSGILTASCAWTELRCARLAVQGLGIEYLTILTLLLLKFKARLVGTLYTDRSVLALTT